MKNYFLNIILVAQRDLIDNSRRKMTGKNVKCINFTICDAQAMCIVYDNVRGELKKLFAAGTQEKKEREKEEKKIVISFENHVMAIHIKNYFLLIQPPASWLWKTQSRKERTTKHSKLINYMPINMLLFDVTYS